MNNVPAQTIRYPWGNALCGIAREANMYPASTHAHIHQLSNSLTTWHNSTCYNTHSDSLLNGNVLASGFTKGWDNFSVVNRNNKKGCLNITRIMKTAKNYHYQSRNIAFLVKQLEINELKIPLCR